MTNICRECGAETTAADWCSQQCREMSSPPRRRWTPEAVAQADAAVSTYGADVAKCSECPALLPQTGRRGRPSRTCSPAHAERRKHRLDAARLRHLEAVYTTHPDTLGEPEAVLVRGRETGSLRAIPAALIELDGVHCAWREQGQSVPEIRIAASLDRSEACLEERERRHEERLSKLSQAARERLSALAVEEVELDALRPIEWPED